MQTIQTMQTMQTVQHIQTVRNPKLSLFQAAVDSVTGARAAARAEGASTAPAENAPHAITTLNGAADALAAAMQKHIESTPEPQEHAAVARMVTVTASSTTTATEGVAPSSSLGSVLVECAKLAFQLGEAKLAGDTAKAAQLESELKDNTCDPDWLEAVTQYVAYFQLTGGAIPYRRWTDLSDFVLDTLPEKAVLAFLGDWGTGTPAATALLQQVAQAKPDILIHLGDIYYAGTQNETDAFYSTCREMLGDIPIFTLAGNHDMYSGGVPYYQLLDRLGQPASYFCLRNRHWQFLAMDTSLHDHDPETLATTMTYLEPSEVEWHLDKIQNTEGRKTVLLSHHQLFTACSDIAGGGVNTHLQNAFQSVLPQISLWLWGHEHNLVQYDPYLGLQRGRCMGHGAIPVFTLTEPYTVKHPGAPMGAARLSNDGVIYEHGYALMSLDGPNGTVGYYQVSQPDAPLWVDML